MQGGNGGVNAPTTRGKKKKKASRFKFCARPLLSPPLPHTSPDLVIHHQLQQVATGLRTHGKGHAFASQEGKHIILRLVAPVHNDPRSCLPQHLHIFIFCGREENDEQMNGTKKRRKRALQHPITFSKDEGCESRRRQTRLPPAQAIGEGKKG